MSHEAGRVDSFRQDICCLMIRWAVADGDLAFRDHCSDKMEADVNVLQLGGDDVLACDLDTSLIVFQDSDWRTVAHAKLM